MNWLTRRDEYGEADTEEHFNVIFLDKKSKEIMGKILESLASYEGTGLTPKEIRKLDELYDEKCEEVAEYQIKFADGKLIELPCRVGDIVYILNTYGNKENWSVYERTVSKFVYQKYSCKRIEVHFEEGRGYALDGMFGETIYLTREEAENALNRMKIG